MSQGDLLIFINVVCWIFFFFFFSFFFFFGNFLPAVFKSVRVQLFFSVFVKQQFFYFLSNFFQKLVWYFSLIEFSYINNLFVFKSSYILKKFLQHKSFFFTGSKKHNKVLSFYSFLN